MNNRHGLVVGGPLDGRVIYSVSNVVEAGKQNKARLINPINEPLPVPVDSTTYHKKWLRIGMSMEWYEWHLPNI